PALSEDAPKRITFDRHSSLTDLTHLSEKEFKLGLLAGNWIGLTFPNSMIPSKAGQNLPSRSCSKYLQFSRNPQVSKVTFLAICCIHSSSGYGVIPARQTLRLCR